MSTNNFLKVKIQILLISYRQTHECKLILDKEEIIENESSPNFENYMNFWCIQILVECPYQKINNFDHED